MAITEEQAIPIEPVAEQPAGEVPANKEVPAPEAKETKKMKVSAPRKRSSPTHPPYFEMIKDAIVTLKERTGSSQYAITRFIEDKQKNLPSNFRKVLLVQLKKLVANGKLVRVKSSFKLPSFRSANPTSPVKKKSVSVPKSNPKAAGTNEKKVVVSKAKLKITTAAAKPRVAASSKAKPATKAKASAPVKATSAPKRKTPENSKAEKKQTVKVAKISTRSTPGKKAVAPPAHKKAPVRSVTPKSINSPAKKAASKRGKK